MIGGRGKVVWVLVLTYVGVLVAVFFVVNSENMKSRDAVETASLAVRKSDDAMKRISEILLQIEAAEKKTDEAVKKLADVSLSLESSLSKMNSRLEWLEMKVQNMPKPSLPSKIVLSQEKPLSVTVVTRPGPPVRAKTTLSPSEHGRLVEEVKKK